MVRMLSYTERAAEWEIVNGLITVGAVHTLCLVFFLGTMKVGVQWYMACFCRRNMVNEMRQQVNISTATSLPST